MSKQKSHYQMQMETEAHIRNNPELRLVLTEFVMLRAELERPPTYDELTQHMGQLAVAEQLELDLGINNG